eukprot:m.171084 g.171084  ORF g.171084 m.171084 type:complete len:156 (+) comp53261_c0_seq43:837-1304(+)
MVVSAFVPSALPTSVLSLAMPERLLKARCAAQVTSSPLCVSAPSLPIASSLGLSSPSFPLATQTLGTEHTCCFRRRPNECLLASFCVAGSVNVPVSFLVACEWNPLRDESIPLTQSCTGPPNNLSMKSRTAAVDVSVLNSTRAGLLKTDSSMNMR